MIIMFISLCINLSKKKIKVRNKFIAQFKIDGSTEDIRFQTAL